MKKSFNYIPIVFGLLVFLIILHKSMELEPIQTTKPTIPKIEQTVSILDNDKKAILESHWLLDNEEDLRSGKITFDECPYTEGKTVYKLKTSMNGITSFVYGSKAEINKQKGIEYKLIKIKNQ
jgi:hypothetical protein